MSESALVYNDVFARQVAGAMDQHPKIQRGTDGSLLLNFGQYGEEVEVAAISGDGRRVSTVHAVGVAEVWDAASGERVGVIRPESPLQGTTDTAPLGSSFQIFIESAALNRDGSTALLGLNDGTAGTFSVSDGIRLATLVRPGEEPAAKWSVIRVVAFSPDGEFALVGFSGRCAGVWSERGDRLVAFLESPNGSKLVGQPSVRDTLVSSIAMSPDNRWLFAGHVDMTATIWDVKVGSVVFAATEHAEDILALFDNADGFGWATTAGTVWQSRDGAAPAKVLSSGEHWAEARFQGTKLLTRGFGDEVKQWNLCGGGEALFVPDARPTRGWAGNAETLDFQDQCILYPEGGNRVAVRSGTESFTIDRDAQLITARFSPTGKAFGTGGWKDEVELWAIPDGKLIHTFASPGGVGDFAFSPDGALLAIGEIGHGGGRYVRHVYIYETTMGQRVHVHTEHQWQVSRVAFSPDGKCLASVGDDIVLWDLDRKRVRDRIAVDRSTTGLQFLSDGRLLVLDQGRARLYRRDKLICEWPVPIEFRTRWCISDDARTLSIALNQAVVRFDLESGSVRVRGTWSAPMPRPDWVPSVSLAERIEARTWAALDRLVAVPTTKGAAVIRIGSEPSLLAHVPFEGKLRASRVVDGDVLLVNEQGRLFRYRLPSR